MSKPKWEDGTSYSRGDDERTPTTWELDLGNRLRLCVTRHVHYQPDQWICLCHQINIDEPLNYRGDDATKAQAEAIAILKKWHARITKAIEAL